MAVSSVDIVLDRLSLIHAGIFLFAFIRGLPVTWNLMMPVFVAPAAVHFRCTDDVDGAANWTSASTSQLWSNSSLNIEGNDAEQCSRRVGIQNSEKRSVNGSEPCTSWVYNRSLYGKTVTEEWNMVCGDRWMIHSVQSTYLAGMVVGSVASSHISDWFGRKWTITGGLLLSLGASASTAFSTSAAMYYTSRFVMAVGTCGYADVIYTLTHRYMSTMTMDSGWTTGMLLLPWLHYLVREWRATQIYAALPLVPLLALSCFLPESPRWLMATGRFSAAKQVVTKFAKQGRGPAHQVDEIIEEAKRAKAAARDVGTASVGDLFSTKLWATTTVLFSFLQIVNNLVWYQTTVSTAGVGGDPYVTFTIGASSEYPARLTNALLIKYCRRRRTICGSMWISAVVMVALWIVPAEYSWVRLALLMVGKVGASASGAVMRVHLCETYPTIVRSVAMGFSSTLGWLGSALAPFFDDLGHATRPWVPNAVAAVLCGAGAGTSWLLAETFDETLQDGFANEGRRCEERLMSKFKGNRSPELRCAAHPHRGNDI
ncbi:solute carrier family 22 member 4-like isoform X2 [Amblyomma americanum]